MSYTITLVGEDATTLANYLIAHEDDIALEREDFGELKWIFRQVNGRAPIASHCENKTNRNKERAQT